jgi:DNA-binding NtrC family response regulator
VTNILIVEDDSRLSSEYAFLLVDEGFKVATVVTAEEAERALAAGESVPDLLLVDIRLPGKSGVDLVRDLAARNSLPPTIVISGEASVREAVEALKLGVHDFLEKPLHRERLLQTVRTTLETTSLRRQVSRLESKLGLTRTILGNSPAIDRLRAQIADIAPTDSRVLIRGESGSGKELVVEALHSGSRRSRGPLIKINCAALAPQLVEDELFGHVKGAFTDARSDKRGLFEEADGGTLFLDEIGDMELNLQTRLLRVLEDGRVRRIGGLSEHPVDVRVVSATHADLDRAIAEKRFRHDLYYRLVHLPIDVPPLRDRPGDIRLLFDHFLKLYCERYDRRLPRVEEDVFERLERWTWPGNVRELKSLAERLAVLAADPIRVSRLPEPYQTGESGVETSAEHSSDLDLSLKQYRAQCEKRYIEAVLDASAWNVSEAARRLGIHRSRLHQKLNELGLRRSR